MARHRYGDPVRDENERANDRSPDQEKRGPDSCETGEPCDEFVQVIFWRLMNRSHETGTFTIAVAISMSIDSWGRTNFPS
jgi:hypothetical protein